MPIQHATAENFEQLVSRDFVIVDFWGTTCVPCKLFARVLEDLDAEIPFLNIVKLNTPDNPEIAEAYHIGAVPTVQFYKNGQLVESHVGVMSADDIKAVLSEHLYS